MAPKGTNSKKEQGRAKKAENEAKKKDTATAVVERKEADEWSKGAKPTKEDKEEKRKAELARKAENARLLAEEEASTTAKPKAKPAAKKKAAPVPAGPGAIAAGGLPTTTPSSPKEAEVVEERKLPPEEFAATGIDDALDLLAAVTQKMDKASLGQAAAGIEKHPERRFKAAFEAYQERELPSIKVDYPGLRLHQYKEILFKQFQKSPENPFNQVTIGYDASKEEKVEALKKAKESTENRLRQL